MTEFEHSFLIWRLEVAFNALISNQLPRFANISTRCQWYLNITQSSPMWNNQYAAAFVGVLYIVERYGFEVVERLLSEVKQGVAYPTAMEQVLGLSLKQFEFRVRLWLFFKGIFDLYLKYTAPVMVLSGLIAILIFVRLKTTI